MLIKIKTRSISQVLAGGLPKTLHTAEWITPVSGLKSVIELVVAQSYRDGGVIIESVEEVE